MPYSTKSFENYDDVALVKIFQTEPEMADAAFEAICSRYLNLISSISSKYRYCAEGYELPDFMQEGLIGLLSACTTFDESRDISFKNYAMLCVENRFRSIRRRSNKLTQIPTDRTVPLDDSVDKVDDPNAMTVQERIESKEYVKSVLSRLDGVLSELEKKVLMLYLAGYSYKQAAVALDVSERTIDNALYRIRKKLSR